MTFFILYIIGSICSSFVNPATDPSKCVSKSGGDSAVIKPQFCLVTKRDVKLTCLHDDIVVFSGLQMAVKTRQGACSKRILGPQSEVCCYMQETDVLYDSQCLKDIWNKEDRNHYLTFVNEALDKCANRSQCVLNSKMFAHLQREIPASTKYASYFQILYQCIKDPTILLKWCSSESASSKEVHLLGTVPQGTSLNKTCTCRASTQTGGSVMVKAVDVRNTHSALILSSGKILKNISFGLVPQFGFRDIFTAPKLNISTTLSPLDNVWLHISDSNGKKVQVTCGETTVRELVTPVVPVPSSTVKRKTVFWGYWPLIYIAAGSFFTILIVSCILGSVLVCRKSSSSNCKDRGRYHHSHPCPADFHQDPYAHPYATVLDDNPHISEPRAAASSMSTQPPQEWRYEQPSVPSTSSRSLCPAPTAGFPPPNVPGRSSDSPSSSYQRSHVMSGKDSDVLKLEAFLKC